MLNFVNYSLLLHKVAIMLSYTNNCKRVSRKIKFQEIHKRVEK